MAPVPSRAAYWRLRLARWPRPPRVREDGYTLLVPVPGDLHVFLELALRVLARQHDRHRRETIVVPDRMTGPMREIVDRHRASWSGPLHLRPLLSPEQWFVPYMRSASRNHGLQIVTALRHAVGSHIVFHDADLFIHDDDMLDDQYTRCVDRDLACLGISPVWDPWYEAHGRKLAATWDMVASVDWLRSFPPHLLIGHDAPMWGEVHMFDTVLHPQVLTGQARVDWEPRQDDFVHFNYVISTYRLFQRHGPGFVDDRFRLVLIALFIEVFGTRQDTPDLPPLADLPAGLTSTTAPVRFPARAEGTANWNAFRTKVNRLLTGPILDRVEADRVAASLASFDDFYGYDPSDASAASDSGEAS